MGLAIGDSVDGYWYNNSWAVGQQLYPIFLNKYYDMFSFDGFYEYAWDWIVETFWLSLILFTFFVPVPQWVSLFSLDWKDWWKFICVGNIICTYLNVEMENGWYFG